MAARFTPFLTPDRRCWVIFDWQLFAYCTLDDGIGNRLPLEWSSRNAADAWLQKCYQRWATWERDGGGVVPANWRPRREPSPYSNGLPFLEER